MCFKFNNKKYRALPLWPTCCFYNFLGLTRKQTFRLCLDLGYKEGFVECKQKEREKRGKTSFTNPFLSLHKYTSKRSLSLMVTAISTAFLDGKSSVQLSEGAPKRNVFLKNESKMQFLTVFCILQTTTT